MLYIITYIAGKFDGSKVFSSQFPKNNNNNLLLFTTLFEKIWIWRVFRRLDTLWWQFYDFFFNFLSWVASETESVENDDHFPDLALPAFA